MRRDISTIIIGLLFLAAGAAIGGSMLGLFEINISLDGWWTIFIIAPALISIAQGGINAGNVIMLGVGAVLFLNAQELLPAGFTWKLAFPVVLLAVGVQLLFGGSGRGGACCGGWAFGHGGHGGRGGNDSGKAPGEGPNGDKGNGPGARAGGASDSADYKTASAFFSGQDLHYQNENFTGASYTAMFGGVIANLRNVTLVGDVVITVSAMFGGIDIILPDNVRVVTHVAPILGGTDCKYVSSRDPLAPCVIVRGSATFGGITIK